MSKSILFKPRRTTRKVHQRMDKRVTEGKARVGGRSVKYVEIYGEILAAVGIAANLTSDLIEYVVPDGHCAELYALGVMPDFGLSENLLDITLAHNDKDFGFKFLCNNLGMNSLPYGDRLSKQPMRLLDYPMRRGNLTLKFNEGVEIEVKATASGAAVIDDVRARARILLYEEADVAAIYGKTISDFATLPGGHDQSLPHRLFADYARLAAASGADSKWTDLYSLAVKDYEQILLSHVGILPHLNAHSLKLYDHRQKWEAPEYEPYWRIHENYNALPFGDDDDAQPTFKLPSIVAKHLYTNTTMKVQIRDTGTAIPQYGLAVQLLGTYRKVR